jgi:hypothetical protein
MFMFMSHLHNTGQNHNKRISQYNSYSYIFQLKTEIEPISEIFRFLYEELGRCTKVKTIALTAVHTNVK